MKIFYEWCYETTDEFGDIIDNYFADKLLEYTEDSKTNQLCLVRNEGDEINGLGNRFWAYVKDGKLPECFEDAGYQTAIKVPQKFYKELSRHYKNNIK